MNFEVIALAALFLIGLIAAVLWVRSRARREAADTAALAVAKAEGRNQPASLHPVVNLDTCMGSLSCLKVCPEGDILGVVDGKAALIDASACIGHGKCANECPVNAITLVFGTSERGVDLPEVDEHFQTNRPGLHIVGELGGMGLIKNALTQGLQVATHLGEVLHGSRKIKGQVDVAIVGSGPSGLATALGLKKAGVSFRVLERETIGGTIAHYPRQKVVMTEKVVLPFVGRFGKELISKEQLLAGWKHAIAKADLKIEEGVNVTGVSGEDGAFLVTTSKGIVSAKKVVLAIGRRGTPRTLGVPGEELPNVTYRLVDATQYDGAKVLVVGGSDSALEAAIQIAEETDAKVTLSYRQDKFGRGREANRRKFQELVTAGRIRALMPSTVKEVNREWVRLEYDGKVGKMSNDFVIACLGGELPTEFLKKSGVGMRRLQGEELAAKARRGSAKKDEVERASRRFATILLVIGVAIVGLLTLKGYSYYTLSAAERVKDAAHAALKPAGVWGHGVGIVATAFMMSNFIYALRKRWSVMKGKGSIRNWLTFHQFVGFMSPLVIAFHATFRSNNVLATATTVSLAIEGEGRAQPRGGPGRVTVADQVPARDSVSQRQRSGRPRHPRGRVPLGRALPRVSRLVRGASPAADPGHLLHRAARAALGLAGVPRRAGDPAGGDDHRPHRRLALPRLQVDLQLSRTHVAVLTVLVATAAHADIFSPGDLAKPHAGLEGISQCTQCHPAGGQLSQATCLGCHLELKPRVEKGLGFHGHIANDKRNCESCHPDHRGKSFAMIDWGSKGQKGFDHSRAAWPLEGKHAEQACDKCHTRKRILNPVVLKLLEKNPERNTMLGVGRECRGCHFDEHRGQEGDDCGACHDPKQWKPAPDFNHADTNYPLRGRHQKVKCDACHPALKDETTPKGVFPAPVSETFMKFEPLEFKACLDCHKDFHDGKFGARCQSCHTVEGWKIIRNATAERAFHDKTKFPLKGEHLDVACTACHGPFPGEKAKFKGLAFDQCGACHADAHVGQLTRAKGARAPDCEGCHTVERFLPPRFTFEQHQKTAYPLEGAHRVVACNACHPKSPALADKIPKAVKLDHDRDTRYPLTGKHAAAPCAKCHGAPAPDRAVQYRPLPMTCPACHEDVHAGQFATTPKTATDCERCHTTKDWKETKFVHQPPFTEYLLDGKHAKVECASCHRKLQLSAKVAVVRYRPLPTNCESCHSDFHQGSFKGFEP
ncbi:MAG: 4Fe-4S ferredoxin iron-sulfur binding domain protein [Myxococcaceae bacterium]|nr:4Fe-4S ferredoxin iron-sulfur binding domain protein [Myxococcaceae bacterium]